MVGGRRHRTSPSSMFIVDDEPRMLDLIAAILDDGEHFRVVGRAGSAQEAARLLIELEADIVLMDVSMPEVDGFQGTRRLLAKSPNLQVVLMSAVAEDAYDELSEDAGARGFVPKRHLSTEALGAMLATRSTGLSP